MNSNENASKGMSMASLLPLEHFQLSILAWKNGTPSAATFASVWLVVQTCYFYLTVRVALLKALGYPLYPQFLPEGENTRLRNYLARLHRKTQ